MCTSVLFWLCPVIIKLVTNLEGKMRKNRKIRILRILCAMLCCICLMGTLPVENVSAASTPVKKNGRLSVKGTRLVNSQGKTVVLKGVSTHGINWFPQYVNKAAFKTLRDNWGVNCIRLAMYTEEYNGYCFGGNQAELRKLINNGVKYATELGMYVIILVGTPTWSQAGLWYKSVK